VAEETKEQEAWWRRYRDDLVIAAVTALVFGRGLFHGLVESWDDQRFLVDFEPVRSISWDHFVTLVSGPHFEAYQPLHLLSYWIDVPLFGPSGPAIHTVSLVLWIGAAMLWRRVFRRLGLGPRAALLAALLYAVHPVQVEVVQWATGRKDVVASLFAAAATLSHLRSERWNDRFAVGALVGFLAAVLTKSIVLPLPLIWLAMDLVLERRAPRAALLRQGPAFVVAGVLAWVVFGLWRDAELVREPLAGMGRATLVAASYGHHLGKALVPWDLSPMYPLHRSAPSLAWWLVPVALAAAIGATKRWPRVRLGLVVFVLWLAPVSNVVPLYFEAHDRYVSFPLLGLALVAGAWIDGVRPRRQMLLALAVVLYGGVTVAQLQHWRSDERLWVRATRVQPESFYAWLKLGEVRRDAGDFEGALRAYERAIEQRPELAVGLGGLFHTLVLADEAELRLTPSRADAYAANLLAVESDSVGLRRLAGTMVQAGYRRAALFPLGRALDLAPIGDLRLGQATVVQLDNGNLWLAEFYASRMSQVPPPLQARFLAAEAAEARGAADAEPGAAPPAADDAEDVPEEPSAEVDAPEPAPEPDAPGDQ